MHSDSDVGLIYKLCFVSLYNNFSDLDVEIKSDWFGDFLQFTIKVCWDWVSSAEPEPILVHTESCVSFYNPNPGFFPLKSTAGHTPVCQVIRRAVWGKKRGVL